MDIALEELKRRRPSVAAQVEQETAARQATASVLAVKTSPRRSSFATYTAGLKSLSPKMWAPRGASSPPASAPAVRPPPSEVNGHGCSCVPLEEMQLDDSSGNG